MAATLELVIKGIDHASGTFKQIDSSAGGLGKTLGGPLKIGALAAVAGLGSAVAIGISFIKAAAEEEASIKRLAAAVDASGGSWAKSGKAIEGVIQDRQKLAFSDDELRSSLALLTAITGDADEALQRQTIAMDFARGANINLETASKLLGKVTDENVNVLGRYGIRVKAGADATELLGLVQKKFSGQSAAFADSTAGKWARVNIQFDNIKETIGMALLPTVSKLADKFATFLEEHEDDIAQMSEDFAAFAEETLPKVESALADVGEAMNDLKTIAKELHEGSEFLDRKLGIELPASLKNSIPVYSQIRGLLDMKALLSGDVDKLDDAIARTLNMKGALDVMHPSLEKVTSGFGFLGGNTDDADSKLNNYTLSVDEANRLQQDLIGSGEDLAGVVGDVGQAMEDAESDIRNSFIAGMDDAMTTMGELQTEADETRKKLFDMFKEPTQEEQIAEANLANYRLELARIEQGLAPLTQAQKDHATALGLTGDEAAIAELMIGGLTRADAERHLQLDTKLIPSTQKELDLLRLNRDAAKEQADVKFAQKPKLAEWQKSVDDNSAALSTLNFRMAEVTVGGPSMMGSIDGVRVMLGNATGAAAAFRDTLYGIPTHIKTQLDLDILRSFINSDPAGVAPIPRAFGGTVGYRELSLIGERGPELVTLPAGSRVHPAGETQRMMGGGGDVHVHFHSTISTASASEMERAARLVGQLVRRHK